MIQPLCCWMAAIRDPTLCCWMAAICDTTLCCWKVAIRDPTLCFWIAAIRDPTHGIIINIIYSTIIILAQLSAHELSITQWGRASHHQNLAPKSPWIDNCLMMIKMGFLEMEASLWLNKKSKRRWRLVAYLVLFGSSRPYPWLILKKWTLMMMMNARKLNITQSSFV